MKNTRFPARFLAFFLAVCMAASLTSLPVWAEDPTPIETGVQINAEDDPRVQPEKLVGDDGPITVTPADGETPASVSINADIESGGRGLTIYPDFGDSVTVEAKDITAENYGISITVGSNETGQNTIELTAGDVTAGREGVVVDASEGHDQISVTVESVTAGTSEPEKTGVQVSTSNGGSENTPPSMATVNVNGDINATGTGVEASATGGGTTIINAENVGQPDKPVGGRGVEASATGSGSTTTVNVGTGTGDSFQGGDIYATGTGVDASASNSGQTEVNAGNISASEDESRGVSASAEGGTATVNADAVSVTGELAVGAEAEAEDSGTATINADSISASGEGSTGISVSVSDGGTANVTVGKDDASGADAAAEGEAAVTGETAAGSGVQAENAASAAETTGGDASGTEGSAETPAVKADGTGIDVDNFGGTATVTVDGDVEAATGIDITLSPAVEGVAIGEVTEGTSAVSGQNNAASEQAENVSQTTITIDGDVNATETGLRVVESSDFSSGSGPHIGETEKVDVVITGTLSAGQQAVVVDQYVTEDNLNLTVWKIEVDGNAPTENDTLVQPAGGDNGNEAGTSGTVENAYNTGAVSTSESSTSVAADTSIAAEPSAGESKTFTDASIQYIIRVDTNVHNSDGTNAGTLSAKQDAALEKDLATGTAGGETYQYAHENDKVYLKIDVTDDSFEVDKAYGDEGVELELIQDEGSGSYYVVVPKGGGVYLSVTLKDKSQDNNENENNNQNQQQNQNQEQNNNPIPANVENLIKVLVVSDSGGSNGNGNVNGNDQPPKNEESGLVVEGTVGSEKLTKIVDDVVDALPTGEALTAMKKGNAIFAAAFDSENAQTLDSGVVNFKGAFDDAKEDKILVPSENDLYWENNYYTVVFSNGTVLRVLCTEYGVLKIPVPKDAAGLGFVVLLGTLESNKAVKDAIWQAAYETAKNDKKNEDDAKAYADAYTRQIANGKSDVYAKAYANVYAKKISAAWLMDRAENYANAFATQIAEGKDENYADYYAFAKAEEGRNEENAKKYADMRADGKDHEYCVDYIDWYGILISRGKEKDYAAAWAKAYAEKHYVDNKGVDYAKAYADKIADGKGDVYANAYAEKIADSWPEEKAKSYAESYADVYRAQIAGSSDENYAKDYAKEYANAYAAQITSGMSDVYAAGYAAAIADGKDEAEAKAAGMAAEDAAQNALNARQSAANANAAGTTEATTAAVNRGDVANNAQQSAANANTGGTPEAASAAGGPAADPDIIRDDDALIDAAIKSALEDARNAQRSAANANAAGTTGAASAANAYAPAPDHSGHRITGDHSGAFGD